MLVYTVLEAPYVSGAVMNDTEVCAWLARYNSTSQAAAANVWRTLADDAAALLLPIEAESVRPTAARVVVDATAHYYAARTKIEAELRQRERHTILLTVSSVAGPTGRRPFGSAATSRQSPVASIESTSGRKPPDS